MQFAIVCRGLQKRVGIAAGKQCLKPRVPYVVPSTTFSTLKVDSFLTGANATYVEAMHESWLADRNSVHASWNAYFTSLENSGDSSAAFQLPPTLADGGAISTASDALGGVGVGGRSDSLGLSHLIRAYQVRGHEAANLDPLGINAFRTGTGSSELSIEHHGFKTSDLDRPLNLLGNSTGGHEGYLSLLANSEAAKNLTLRVLKDKLKKTYTSGIGIEYMHIGNKEQCNWIRNRVETSDFMNYSKEKKLHIYERLAFANLLEKFLQVKFTDKRFGVDGGEAAIAGLKALIDRGSEKGIENFAIGMPHRGRLNVLVNVMRKPLPQLLREFKGTHFDLEEYMEDESWVASGDVKYHLGTSMDRTYPDQRKIHISVLANPSHLEAVNPVVAGKVRAKQYLSCGNSFEKVAPILLHGDAAFAGQGIVYETMQMSKVNDFAVGGTVHVVINNQIGFTTDPANGRSTPYCSDIGKAFNIPIFHANGDDPVAVHAAFELAIEWRQEFHTDVIVDVVCYRRHGHNENDQAVFTQPVMYSKIRRHPDPLQVYEKKLLNDGVCTQEHFDKVRGEIKKTFDEAWEDAKDWEAPSADWLSSKWTGFLSPKQLSRIRPTGVDLEVLTNIGRKVTSIPDSAEPNPQIAKIYEQRAVSIDKGAGIDWATAESLAFGSLLMEGNHVRLTGQDVQRGTFSHRHAVIRNQATGEGYCPLNHLADEVVPSLPSIRAEDNKNENFEMKPNQQAEITIANSILSEFGVLGFECGYSLENPNMLCMWEAQFGDFVNGAQIIIDQFISAGEDKWLRQSGLTMLLPHGYMGQGAEHSSCRIERFLQQCDEDSDRVPDHSEQDIRTQNQLHNWQVVNCTTPANYFHVLRRQIHRRFRKPLIIATPKNLLRDKNVTSTLEEMGPGTKFKRVYGEVDDKIANGGDNVKTLILCSGKLYYELVDARKKLNIDHAAIVRVEQLAPFPWDHVAREARNYSNADIIWCQEEPKNMGAWSYVEPRIATAINTINNTPRRSRYVGRNPAAATATGLGSRAHNAEQQTLIAEALGVTPEELKKALGAK